MALKLRPGSRWSLSSTQILAIGFFAVIMTGAILLTLPISATSGESIGFVDALFTAASCTCVTGLSTINVGVELTTFGHVVMLLLIQIGGMGFMTCAALIFMAVGRKIGLKDRMTIAEGLNEEGLGGMVKLVRKVAVICLVCEGVGALLLSFRLVPEFGFAKGVWFGVFHAVSAFCNAGFDIFGYNNSIENFNTEPFFILVIALLIIIGGLGFAVVNDVLKKRRWSRLSLHSKLVLTVTAGLLLFGTLFFLFAEWNNPKTIGDMGVGDKVANSFFQAATLRTAGYATLTQQYLTNGSIILCILLMFIGASPASCGGGVKTTTFGTVLLNLWAVIRGREDISLYGRRISKETVRRCMAIILICLLFLVAFIFLLCLTENGKGFTPTEIVYECTSALATVGNTMGITTSLSQAGRVILSFAMFCGRVGPLSLALALGGKGVRGSAKFPEEKIMVG